MRFLFNTAKFFIICVLGQRSLMGEKKLFLSALLKHLRLTYTFSIFYVAINALVYFINGMVYPPQSNRNFTLITSWFNWTENYDKSLYHTFLAGFAVNFLLPLIAILGYELYSYYVQSKYTLRYIPASNSFILGIIATYILSWISYSKGEMVGSGTSILGICLFVTFIVLVLVEVIVKKYRENLWESMKETASNKIRKVILLIVPSLFAVAEIPIVKLAYLGNSYYIVHLTGLFIYSFILFLSIPLQCLFNTIKGVFSNEKK